MQWYNEIAQHFFDIEHVKGKNKFIADYLNRPTKLLYIYIYNVDAFLDKKERVKYSTKLLARQSNKISRQGNGKLE